MSELGFTRTLLSRHLTHSAVRLIIPLCICFAMTFHSTGYAAPLSWNNIAGGSAAIAANWNPAQVPTAVDDLTFNLAGAYSVSWNATVSASRTHTYRQGTVTNSFGVAHSVSNGISVGNLTGDNATMTLTSGTLTSNAAMIVGNAIGSTGTLNVTNNDTHLIIGAGSDLTIGLNGSANLSVTSRGHVQVADQFIAGSNATSAPTILVSGALAFPPFGSSTLEVLGTSLSFIGAGGDVAMTISSGGFADFAGNLVIANGSASVSSVTVQTAVSFINARLNVDGDLLIGRNTNAVTPAGVGTLEINTGGIATIGGETLVGDPDGGSGTILLGGGTFTGAEPVQLLAGSSIFGTGTVNADVTVGPGSIVPTTASGLTINGVVNCTTAGVSGTKIHFGAGGGYLGSGNCQADITGDAGATITATGPLTIGRNTTAGFSYLGSLAVGPHSVTLVDSNGAVLGGPATISSGGTLTCLNGIGVQLGGGRIQGEGALFGNVTVSGVLDPQRSPTPGGILNVVGNLHINPSGEFQMQIGGPPASNQHDRLNASGTATFNGTIRVTLAAGYVPKVGEQFIAINATGGRTGEFATTISPNPAPCNGVTFITVYSSTAAIVLIRPPIGCTALGDLNSDGTCDGLDLQEFVDSMVFGPYNSCADMNGDCVNDISDIPIFVNCLL